MRQLTTIALSALFTLTLAACAKAPSNNFDEVYQSITPEKLKQHTTVLASDEFAGRLPATDGERKTLDYLVTELKRMGLQPGNGDSYLQAVELMQIEASPQSSLTLHGDTLTYQQDMVVFSKHEQAEISVTDSDIVFVGYGVNAPEYNWNDYAGVDVRGKTVVILINDPGFANPEGERFQGETMTYYGRWTYKYEEAARQGAAAAIIVHDTAPASYDWSVVANSWSGPQYKLPESDGGKSNVKVEAWITLARAKALFAQANLDFVSEAKAAAAGPYHRQLNLQASATVFNRFQSTTSYNVVATLPGTELPEEHIVVSAHWDHLGTDSNLPEDHIYNGLVDNASGTAASLLIAEAASKLQPGLKRSLTLALVTAEEQGLLGSKFFAENPPMPVTQIVANLNMDALGFAGMTHDVAVVGKGKSSLEENLAQAAARQNRVVVEEGHPSRGYYYRSDHFSFAKVGVPAMYITEGVDAVDPDYRAKMKAILNKCYHQTCDQDHPDLDYRAATQETQLIFDVAHQVANQKAWPTWSATSEFQRK